MLLSPFDVGLAVVVVGGVVGASWFRQRPRSASSRAERTIISTIGTGMPGNQGSSRNASTFVDINTNGNSVVDGDGGSLEHSGSGPFATALSLTASAFSGITLLAAPAEAFEHGIAFAATLLVLVWVVPIVSEVFLPWLWRSGVESVYQLLEQRYKSSKLRTLASCLFVTSQLGYVSVALYAPAQALVAVTDISVGILVCAFGLLSAFLALLGGVRGVIWTDAVLSLILVGSLFAITIGGTRLINGGLFGVLQVAGETGRLNMPALSFQERTSVWPLILGGSVNALAAYITNQNATQHLLSQRTLGDARKTILLQLPFSIIAIGVLYFIGLIMHAVDVQQSQSQTSNFSVAAMRQQVDSADQLLLYFVVKKLPGWGMPGLLLSALIAATLSTACSVYASAATCVAEDILPQITSVQFSRRSIINTLACTSIVFGWTCGIAPSILFLSNTVLGLAAGPLLGIFILTLGSDAKEAVVICSFVAGLCLSLLMVAAQLGSPLSSLGSMSFMWIPFFTVLSTVLCGILATMVSRG